MLDEQVRTMLLLLLLLLMLALLLLLMLVLMLLLLLLLTLLLLLLLTLMMMLDEQIIQTVNEEWGKQVILYFCVALVTCIRYVVEVRLAQRLLKGCSTAATLPC